MTHTPTEDDFVPLMEIKATFTKEELLAALADGAKVKVRATACVAACAGIPTDKLRPGIVRDLIAAARLACGVVPMGGSGVYKHVDAEPLRALLRELVSE